MSGKGPSVFGVDDLDASRLCAAMQAAHQDRVALECYQLRLAAHWIDVHAPEDHPDAAPSRAGRVLPGTERTVRVGADGTPEIGEFAAAEFAALHGLHPQAGATRLRKIANLRHRHPLLWFRVLQGEVESWKALETARLVGRDDLGLSLESAHRIDAQSCEWISTLPWGAFLDLIERLIIEADPAGAEHRRTVAETTTFVATTQTSEHGLKTLIARANAGQISYLVAVVDRLAEILAQRGDTGPIGPRRAAALGILAHPAQALTLLAEGTSLTPHPDDPDPDDLVPPPDKDDPAGGPGHDDDAQADAATHTAPDADGAAGVPSYLRMPADLAATLTRLRGIGLDRFLPPAVLYVHVDHKAFATGQGAATVEGLGLITVGQAQEWLGHRRVKVVPVLDPASPTPVDGYVFPDRMRTAAHLTNPRDVFPYAVNTRRGKDIDHPDPYVPPEVGGGPGQTGLHNAAPMVRHHHRLKTHGRWRLRQVQPGVYLWTSPHGYTWLTDPHGTRPLPAGVAELIHHALDTEEREAA